MCFIHHETAFSDIANMIDDMKKYEKIRIIIIINIFFTLKQKNIACTLKQKNIACLKHLS